MELKHSKQTHKLLSIFLSFALILSILSIAVPAQAESSSLWTPGTYYQAGDIVHYDGNNYECLQPHTALVGWEPSNVPALWRFHSSGGGVAATPIFHPPGGTYRSEQAVSITSDTKGAVIRYTVDGSQPNNTSPIYSEPITLSKTTTVKAMASAANMADSETVSAEYKITLSNQAEAPVLHPAEGTYYEPQTIIITTAENNAVIRYTMDGSTPNSASTLYTDPILVSATATIKARAFKSGMIDSEVTSGTYTIKDKPEPIGDKLLVGYWHNFDNNLTPIMPLREISHEWDVINVAFADIEGNGTVSFTPFNASDAEFKSDVAYLKSLGKDVVLSLGGQNGALNLPDAASTARFTNSLIATIDQFDFSGVDVDIETGISLAGGDSDFRNPTTPTIVNLIKALKDVCEHYGANFTLGMAPEIAYVQGGIAAYGGPWGAYLPIIHAMRDQLSFIHVQHYNSGSNAGLDGKTYNQGTADFEVAMAEMLLNGFPIGGNSSNMFPALRQEQVMIGIPAAVGAAPSGGYINPVEMKKALDYLIHGIPFGGQYQMQNPAGYPEFRGLMTWSINWDVQNNYEFTRNYYPYFKELR